MKNQLLITKAIILIKNIFNEITFKKMYHAQLQLVTKNNPLQITTPYKYKKIKHYKERITHYP